MLYNDVLLVIKLKSELSFVFLRMCITLVFYGLSLNTSNLNGNIYLNCFFSAAVDSFSYVAIWLLADRAPRPTLLSGITMFSGVTLLTLKLIPEGQTFFIFF